MQINNKEKILQFIPAVSLILLAIAFRIAPHLPNFTPITALALFGSAYLSRKTAFVLPITAMFVSDVFIGFYDIKIMIAVYLSFIITSLLGLWLKKHKKPEIVFFCVVASSLIFFFITNFAVFVFSPWYAKSFAGLLQCFVMALPFLRNTLLGDLFYTASFFSIYEIIRILVIKKFKVKNYKIYG